MQLIATGPAKQRRLTVAFRSILAIPHGFVLIFLNLAGFVVAFLGWWGALFMGRLPEFAVTYLSGLARWNARVNGYLYLLTDVYPPFNFEDDPAYPVVIAIPPPGRLNRYAVFFRLFLSSWANLVLTLVLYGASTIVIFIAWLITLITGKLPTPLHLAFTAMLRFQTRYYCYLGLLTPTYPWKLFGDEPDVSAPVTGAPAETAPPTQSAETAPPAESAWGTPSADWTPPADGTPPGYGTTPAYGTAPGYDTAPGYGTTPGYDTTPGYGTPGSVYGTPSGYGSAGPAAQPANWRLVLPRSAKNLLILFIVLGVITEVGGQVARAVITNRAANSVNAQAAAVSQWNSAANAFNAKMTAWSASESACQSLTCATHGAAQAASYMSAFASQVRGIAMPTAATSAAAAKTAADATSAAADLTTVSKDTTVAQFQADESSSGVTPDLDALQAAINSLGNALNALNAPAAS